MSIEIIGSNNTKIKIITESQIESIINDQELIYNLYKKKYGEECKHSDEIKDHLVKQLITKFYYYDNNKNLKYNIHNFVKYLTHLNSNNNIITHINNFLYKHNLLENLHNSIQKTIIKIIELNTKNKIEKIKLNKNFYLDILHVLKLLENTNIKNDKIELYTKIIKENLNKLNTLLKDIKIIHMKTLNINYNKNYKSCEFISVIFKNLDNLINNNKMLKTNILKIDSIINIITENLFKIYELL